MVGLMIECPCFKLCSQYASVRRHQLCSLFFNHFLTRFQFLTTFPSLCYALTVCHDKRKRNSFTQHWSFLQYLSLIKCFGTSNRVKELQQILFVQFGHCTIALHGSHCRGEQFEVQRVMINFATELRLQEIACRLMNAESSFQNQLFPFSR